MLILVTHASLWGNKKKVYLGALPLYPSPLCSQREAELKNNRLISAAAVVCARSLGGGGLYPREKGPDSAGQVA